MPRYFALVDGHEIGFEIVEAAEGTLLRVVSSDGEDGQADQVRVDLAPVHASAGSGEGLYSLLADDRSYQLYVERREEGFRMVIWRSRFEVRVLTEREWRLQKVAPRQAAQTGEVTVKAPMPGLVKSVLVAAGDQVTAGQRMLVLEAMKMENDINSPRDGTIAGVYVQQGAVVEGGKPLLKLE